VTRTAQQSSTAASLGSGESHVTCALHMPQGSAAALNAEIIVRILKVLLETGFRVSGRGGFRSPVPNTPLSRRGLLERGGVSRRLAEGGFWNRVFSRSWFSEALPEPPVSRRLFLAGAFRNGWKPVSGNGVASRSLMGCFFAFLPVELLRRANCLHVDQGVWCMAW
jgi:hypothetical protein